MNKAIQYTLGISLIFLGMLGLFLPFLQGILFIAVGVLVLKADDVAHAKRIISKSLKKFKRKK